MLEKSRGEVYGNSPEREHGVRERTRDLCAKIVGRNALNELTNIAVVTAHSDDEVIGYGTIISQIPDILAIQVTDSAPKVPKLIDSSEEPEAFKRRIREVRRTELHTALDIAGHNSMRRECLNEADQDVMNRIGATAAALVDRFQRNRVEFVMTHAYEGGHPDHDAVAVSVHLVKAVLATRGIDIGIIETPLYKGVPGNQGARAWQEFADGINVSPEDIFVKTLSPQEQDLKRRLYGAHASQAHIFTKTFDDRELFRVAPRYDFNVPPNNGHLTDIFPEFGLTEEKWRTLIADAERQLGL